MDRFRKSSWPRSVHVDVDDRAIANRVFNDGWRKWATRRKADGLASFETLSFEGICMELSTTLRPFSYDFLYFDLSAYVHSTPPSIVNFVKDLHDEYEVRHFPRREKTVFALLVANMSMILALSTFNDWAGPLDGFSERLKELWGEMTAAAQEVAQQDVETKVRRP